MLLIDPKCTTLKQTGKQTDGHLSSTIIDVSIQTCIVRKFTGTNFVKEEMIDQGSEQTSEYRSHPIHLEVKQERNVEKARL